MAASRAPIKSPELCVLTGEPGLSLAAKAIATYVLCRPPRTITRAELFRSCSDPMAFVDGAIRELVACGLVETVPGRGRGRPRDTAGIQLRQPSAQTG